MMFKKVSVVFLLLVTVFVSCSEEEPSIIEVERDILSEYDSSLEYNDKISFNIMPITNITNGSIDSITLAKDFDGIISLAGPGRGFLKGMIEVSDDITQVISTNFTKVDLEDNEGDVSKVILHMNSFPVQKGNRISVVIFRNTFIDSDGKINKEIKKEVTVP